MSLRTIWAWTRMVVTAVLLVMVILVILMNRNHTATVWLFHSFVDVSVLWLIVVTAIISIAVRWIVSGVYRAWKVLQAARKQDKIANVIKHNQEQSTKSGNDEVKSAQVDEMISKTIDTTTQADSEK